MDVLRDLTSGDVIARSVKRARTAWERAIGLLGKRKLQPDQGLWLEPCTAVHTIGMQMPVDIILLDASHRVIAILPGVCPMCALVTRPGTKVVIELKSGAAAHSGIAVGNHLSLEAA